MSGPRRYRRGPLSFVGEAMRALISRFLRDQAGVTAVEYGLLVACICIALIEGLTMFQSSFTSALNTLSTTIASH